MRCCGCRPRELEEADAAVGAADAEDAVAILDVADRGLEFLRGQVLRALDRALGGDAHRRAADEERARAGAAESRAAVGVALHDPDLLDRHAEDVDGDLRERRGESLAHRLQRGEDLDFAVARRP